MTSSSRRQNAKRRGKVTYPTYAYLKICVNGLRCSTPVSPGSPCVKLSRFDLMVTSTTPKRSIPHCLPVFSDLMDYRMTRTVCFTEPGLIALGTIILICSLHVPIPMISHMMRTYGPHNEIIKEGLINKAPYDLLDRWTLD